MASTDSSDSILSCSNIVKRYDDGEQAVTVLDDVSLSVNRGEQIAIVGASGSGKSSLLHILGALDQPNSGQVFLNSRSILGLSRSEQARLRNENLGFVYQFHHLLAEFSALENVAMPLLIAGKSACEANDRAQASLKQVGLAHRSTHAPGALSGGERQRVAIARAIVNSPDIVLADEPTGNLDSRTGQQIYELMLSLQESLNMAFVVVTHDLTLASHMQRIVTLVNGKLEAK